MKKILLATLVAVAVINTADAQTAVEVAASTTATTDTKPTMKTMTKAEKETIKAKKEADLVEAFTKAGLSADEQVKCRAILDESNEKTKPIKGDASLGDDAKKEKLDAIYNERNDNLKAAMGDAKYKVFKATQKAQKEAAAAKNN